MPGYHVQDGGCQGKWGSLYLFCSLIYPVIDVNKSPFTKYKYRICRGHFDPSCILYSSKGILMQCANINVMDIYSLQCQECKFPTEMFQSSLVFCGR